MTKPDVAVSRIKYYKKSGARLYIPQSVVNDPEFPFVDGELVKIEVGNPVITLTKPTWFEMLNWNEMKDTYELLPEQIKEEIKNKGLAPNI
jgi:predicted nuclease with TOPRIM domain